MSDPRFNLSYNIKKLVLLTKAGPIDITKIFDSINIYDSIFSPCMSGNILISDAIGLTREMHLDGSESIDIEIEKKDCVAKIKKRFRVYADKPRVQKDNSESYLLHFISPEWIKSKELKLNTPFKDTYSNIARKILTSESPLGLNVDPNEIAIEESVGIRDVNFSGKSPISCILDCTKKSINSEFSPTYMFFENVKGFNFFTLSTLTKSPQIYNINFDPKSFYGSENNSLLGARKMEVVSQYNLLQNIDSGIQGATHVAFCPWERTYIETQLDLRNIPTPKIPFTSTPTNLRFNPNASRSYNSVVISHVTAGGFLHSDHLRSMDPASLNSEDNTMQYVAQRRALLKSYMSTRIRLEMPGNFDLSSGYMVNFKKSIAGRQTESSGADTTLSGRYMIIASRNIIKYESHITVLELATNTFNGKLYEPVFYDNAE
jgi:hypothetical protein